MSMLNSMVLAGLTAASLIGVSAHAQQSCDGIYTASLAVTKTKAARTVAPQTISVATRMMIEALHASSLKNVFTDPKNTKIDWHKFNDLQGLKQQVQTYSEFLHGLSSENRSLELIAFKEHLEKDTELKKLFDKMEQFQKFEYLPTQYEMRKKVVEEIIAVLKILPQDFRPRVAKVAWDQRRKNSISDANNFMQEFVKRFDGIFHTTGFSDYQAYEKAVRAVDDPIYKKAISIIDNNQLEIAMRRPENTRFWAPKVGFQNQFVTQSSKGSFNNAHRNKVEAQLTETSHDLYVTKDNEFKPKYATIRTTMDSGLTNDRAGIVSHYGEDLYIFKDQAIRDRLSYTVHDSFGSYNSTGLNQTWINRFIPWNRRLLMIPYVIQNLREKNMFFVQGTDPAVPIVGGKEYSSYWEAQIFGRLDLNMVESFEFQKTPPEGEFLAELQKRNIKIYDGRSEKPVLWEAP